MTRSIVMIEWSRENEPTHQSRDEFLWHQMLLSLLYDEVLAQDETFLVSRRMTKWFGDSDGERLLEEIFECGGLAVLKRPLEKYPDEMRDRAVKNPIGARREQLERFSVNNDGEVLRFKGRQLRFHNRLESLLADRPRVHRHAGARKPPNSNLMEEFSRLFVAVLTDKRYEKWLRSKFKDITPGIAQEFARFAQDPKRAVDHLRKYREDHTPRFTPFSDKPEFSTALAVQVAATYPTKAAKTLQSLTETIFARPYCQEEQAEGRYGRLLRDLPLATDIQYGDDEQAVNVVRVETTPLRLPLPGPNFSAAINKVRDKQSGRNLRAAMSEIGPEPTFTSATRAWRDVADDLACEMSLPNTKEFTLQTVAVEKGKEVICGVLAGGAVGALIHGTGHLALTAMEATLGGFAGPLVDILGTRYYRSVQLELKRRRIVGPLEGAVKFSCVQHPTVKAAS